LTPSQDKIRAALSWDGVNAAYWYRLASAKIRALNDDPLAMAQTAQDRNAVRRQINRLLEQAVALNPFHSAAHIAQGGVIVDRLRDEGWQDADGWHAADLAFDRAVYFGGPLVPERHRQLGYYWLVRALGQAAGASGRWQGWQRSSWHYRQALAHTPSHSRKALLGRIEADLSRATGDGQIAKKVVAELLAQGD